jgi:ribosomal protein S18 acetylase RimI-like enzyme
MFPKLNGLCKFLDWDSEHFNKRIAQVTSSFLDQDDFKIVDHWCITNNIDCVYYLKDLSNFTESAIEESNNFRLVDTRVEFKLKIENLPTEQQFDREIKVFSLGHHINNELLMISDKNINNTRFYNDNKFDSDLVKKMYRIWIKKSCEDPSTTVLTAEYKNKIVGFITFKHGHEKISTIGLLAIDKNYQRLGIGKSIMNECIHLSFKQKKPRISVATQLNNQPAINFYERSGFKVFKKSNWYHKWYT